MKIATVGVVTDRQTGRLLDSAPSPNVVGAMATMVGPATFCMFPLNQPSPKIPRGRCKHLQSICHRSRVIGDFVQILGSKFWALEGLNQKLKKTVL